MLPVLLLVCATDPGPPLGPPRLPAGTERVFRGTADEVGRGTANPFRKRAEVEVRLLVLASHAGGSDCGVLTRVWPLADPLVAGPAAALTGREVRPRGEPAVRLDLVRVDPRGRVGLLPPVPFAVGPSAVATPLPPPPLEGLPAVEGGFFVPLPPRPVGPGDAWDEADPGRPPVRWAVGAEADWNGAAAVVVSADQRGGAGVLTWRRTDALTVLPADGFAVSLHRAIERREGAAVVGEVRVSLERVAAGRLVGGLLVSATREAEAAVKFAAELAPLLAAGPRADRVAVRALLVRVQRHLDERPPNGPFRDAVDAVRAGGEALLK